MPGVPGASSNLLSVSTVRRQDMFSSFSTPYIGRGVWQGGRGTFNFRAFPVVVFFRGGRVYSMVASTEKHGKDPGQSHLGHGGCEV